MISTSHHIKLYKSSTLDNIIHLWTRYLHLNACESEDLLAARVVRPVIRIIHYIKYLERFIAMENSSLSIWIKLLLVVFLVLVAGKNFDIIL